MVRSRGGAGGTSWPSTPTAARCSPPRTRGPRRGRPTMPERIQLRRTKGWRLPAGAVNVARPSRWGNPYWVAPAARDEWRVCWRDRGLLWESWVTWPSKEDAVRRAIEQYRNRIRREGWDLAPLRGRDLACWCPLDQPCHADVLLDLANPEETR